LATGDQPKAIKKLVQGLKKGYQNQTLLGVTGSGKTFTMANVIQKVQKPTLVISPNKTLAAQLYGEFRQFFPDNAVHYFVSYYDYYQPEAYMPQTDTYIEKEATINEEIDRLRHAATQAVLTREDVIIVASVSCIYGLGSPESYQDIALDLHVGQEIKRQELLGHLIDLQYDRNDKEFKRGTFMVKGEIIEVHPVTGDQAITIEFFGNEITSIKRLQTRKVLTERTERRRDYEPLSDIQIYPAKHYIMHGEKQKIALDNIRKEAKKQIKFLKKQNKLLEAQRIEQRVKYDLEMIEEIGYCNGIENYSRHFDGRQPGQPSYVLLDFFPDNFLTIIDESHYAVPQISGMYAGDRARKETLVSHGFRLPCAFDNRPLNFKEFREKTKQIIYTSATPGEYELKKSQAEVIKENVVMIHGSSSRSTVNDSDYVVPNRRHWHGWLENQLNKEGVVVNNPIMPTYWQPGYQEWKRVIEKFNINNNTILVGTSCGGTFSLKWLHETKKRIKKLILIAPSYQLIKGEERMKNFVNFKLDPSIKKQVQDIVVFVSNDQTHRVKSSHLIAKKLNAKLITLKNRGHFCVDDTSKNEKFPELFEEIMQSISKTKIQSTIVEQLIRPTGLLDPDIEVRETENQIADLISEIQKRVKKNQRVLITTLTKRMAEELADYLAEKDVNVHYLHSEVHTIERVDILRDLRQGKYDCVVGINLLREGLDLPEVSLVVILDADKQGFLRNETTLIQTMGRAARHAEGQVIMYADQMTDSMKQAIRETTRRRKIQEKYNKKHGIKPRTIAKEMQKPLID